MHEADAWRQSPLAGVSHATTPFLLLQGQEDTTDPLGQSQEMYRALRQWEFRWIWSRIREWTMGRWAERCTDRLNEPWHGFDARQRVVAFFNKEFAGAK